jgi:ectoine hydroxylase-related dioxygenase (phytanoyl-CoA dioxygenase family)
MARSPEPGLFVIRFPSQGDPGDAGWHIDGSFDVGGEWWVNLRSLGRALLMLFLFTDVGPDDAPTRILVGSHLDIPRVLESLGEGGTHFENVMPAFPHADKRRVALATGNAGDVYLCHPFLVHAASWPHRGTTPRFMAQPELPPVAPLELERADADYSAVEIAIRLGLGLHQRN